MKKDDHKDEYQKTQAASSPGHLGEQVNRNKNKVMKQPEKSIEKTALDEGLNQEKSQGDAGAFEGFENTEPNA